MFILDGGLTLYQWNGSGANRYEKVKGLELLTKINSDERGGKAQLVFLGAFLFHVCSVLFGSVSYFFLPVFLFCAVTVAKTVCRVRRPERGLLEGVGRSPRR